MSGSATGADGAIIDTKRVAAMLGFAEQTLRAMRITGKGPPYLKLNRAVRYRVRDVVAWLDARVTLNTSAA